MQSLITTTQQQRKSFIQKKHQRKNKYFVCNEIFLKAIWTLYKLWSSVSPLHFLSPGCLCVCLNEIFLSSAGIHHMHIRRAVKLSCRHPRKGKQRQAQEQYRHLRKKNNEMLQLFFIFYIKNVLSFNIPSFILRCSSSSSSSRFLDNFHNWQALSQLHEFRNYFRNEYKCILRFSSWDVAANQTNILLSKLSDHNRLAWDDKTAFVIQ